jgi:hypothetical protein
MYFLRPRFTPNFTESRHLGCSRERSRLSSMSLLRSRCAPERSQSPSPSYGYGEGISCARFTKTHGWSGYYNPILAYGEAKAIQDARAAGANGFIVVDLPPEEAVKFREICAANTCVILTAFGYNTIFLTISKDIIRTFTCPFDIARAS